LVHAAMPGTSALSDKPAHPIPRGAPRASQLDRQAMSRIDNKRQA
jgi:hypothetical protein